MSRMDEQLIFADFIGKRINRLRLKPIALDNGGRYSTEANSHIYIISYCDYAYNEVYRGLFKLTPTLLDRWECRGNDFRIYIYVSGNIITGGKVFKYIETSCSARPSGYETDATQQELRIVKRVLTYITSSLA